jgi:ubiquinone/menaquinone biosynthesis C-methylase UbiE
MSIEKAKIFPQLKFEGKIERCMPRIVRDIVRDPENAKILSLVNKKRGISVKGLTMDCKREFAYILKKVAELEKSGIIKLELSCDSLTLRRSSKTRDAIFQRHKKNPSLCNLIAYEKECNAYPSLFNFLDKGSQIYKLKALEREIYFDLIAPFLNRLKKSATVLDAGGGIGRFAVQLSKMGHRVHLVDYSEQALKMALRNLTREGAVDFELHWADVTNLSIFSDDTFDATFAIELICYSDNPAKMVRELVRVTRRKGLIIISVEGKYGGLLSDSNVSFDKLLTIFQDDLLYIKNYLYVHYYTPASLRRLLENSGVKIIGIFGSHYVTEGIFHRLIDINKLNDKNYKNRVLKIEKLCQRQPVLKNLARAWVAVGTKK